MQRLLVGFLRQEVVDFPDDPIESQSHPTRLSRLPVIEEDQVNCEIHHRKLSSHYRFKEPIALHDKDNGNNSQYCKKVMVSGAATISHEVTCTSKSGYVDNRVTCGVCQKEYNSDKILRNHMRTIHGPSVGSLKCDHCWSDKFTRLKSLKGCIKGCEKIQTGRCFTAL